MRLPRHILITGASSGIGEALSDFYAAPGICLSLHGRNHERLRQAAARATAQGATVHTEAGDITDAQAFSAWVHARDTFQPLDLVIANAGISSGTSRAHGNDPSTQAIFAVNLFGVLNTINAALPLMAARGQGQIALMSSLASFRGLTGSSAYSASKAAVRIYGEAMRSEWAPRGIEVNVICPGFIKTPLTDENRFTMPFLMTAPRAAVHIAKGLSANRARVAFPWPMYLIVQLMAVMPQNWLDHLTRRLPQKGAK